jgi:putative ABC transport system permease protein
VLGLTGGLVGVALGTLGAVAAIPLIERYTGQVFPGLDVRPLELLAILAVGTGTGALAAVLPARGAARQDPVAALHGRRPALRTQRRVPVLAVVVTGAGVALAATGSALALSSAGTPSAYGPTMGGGSDTYLSAGLIAGGAGLALIGLIVLSPTLVALAGRLGRFLPLAPRLALRDAARHRGRSAPAVAAVLAAVSGSVALSLYVAALDDADRRSYGFSLPMASAGVPLQEAVFSLGEEELRSYDADAVARALESTLPVESLITVGMIGSCMGTDCRSAHPVMPPERECPLAQLGRAPTEAEQAAAAEDPRCSPRHGWHRPLLIGTPVGGTDVLEAMTGTASPDAAAALAAGGIVVHDPRYVVDGQVRVHVYDASRQSRAQLDTGEPLEVVTLPAAAGEDAETPYTVFSLAAAERLGMAVEDGVVVAQLTRLPTQAEEDALHAALTAAGVPPDRAVVERGYVSDYGLGLLALVAGAAVITLGAVGIATGLAQVDARPDHATLAAVGAAPRVRRTLAACQALSIAGLGGLLGIAAGFVPGVAFVSAVPSLELILPWRNLLLVLIGLPALAAAVAWLFTRSRLPLDRRAT